MSFTVKITEKEDINENTISLKESIELGEKNQGEKNQEKNLKKGEIQTPVPILTTSLFYCAQY